MKYYFVPIMVLVLNGVEPSDNWVEPHAWGRETEKHSNEQGGAVDNDRTRTCSSLDERVSFTYYKKLISFFFDRKKFNYDEDTGTLNYGFVVSLSPEQLDILATSLDPRELDAILTDILPNTSKQKLPACNNNSLGLFTEMRMMWMNLSLSAEMNFILLSIAFVLLGIYVHKRYNYGLLITLIFGFFLIGFVYSYIDCNRKLKITQMAEALDPKKDPCGEEVKPSGMWKIVSYFWSSSKKAECLEYLKEKHKIQADYCRPDEVFMSYLNEIIFNQFKLIIERCTEIIRTCTVNMRFPYNIVALIIFGVTLLTFLQSVFKHVISPKNWVGYLGSARKRTAAETESEYDKRDRISGKNLETLLRCLQHRTEIPNAEVQRHPIVTENSSVEIIESLSHADEKSILKQEFLAESKEKHLRDLIKCDDLGPE